MREKQELYGNLNFHQFLPQIIGQSDLAVVPQQEVGDFVDSIYGRQQFMDIDLINLSYALRTKGLYEAAAKANWAALKKFRAGGPTAMDELSIYFQTFKNFQAWGKQKEALTILQEGYAETKDTDEGLLYPMGYHFIDSGIDPKQGVEILRALVAGKHKPSLLWTRPLDGVDAKIAEGYWLMKDKKKARDFINQALSVNPLNEAAIKQKALYQ